MCRVTVLRLESLFVWSNRISMCRVTLLCLEFLFVRSNRIYYVSCDIVEYGIFICTVK